MRPGKLGWFCTFSSWLYHLVYCFKRRYKGDAHPGKHTNSTQIRLLWKDLKYDDWDMVACSMTKQCLALVIWVKPTLEWATTGSVPSQCSFLLYCLWDWVDNGQVIWGELTQMVNSEFLRPIFPNITHKVIYEIAVKYKALFSIAPPLKKIGCMSFRGRSGKDWNCQCWDPKKYNYLELKLKFRSRTIESSSLL